jgi:hypothetical protein
MNDVHKSSPPSEGNRKELVELFLRRTQDEVDQMRRSVPALIHGDVAAWQDVRFCAQRIWGTAKGLELGILSACAQELASLAEEKFAGAKLDAHFLLSVTSAIEMVAIELSRISGQ